jgi:hypothetical protein
MMGSRSRIYRALAANIRNALTYKPLTIAAFDGPTFFARILSVFITRRCDTSLGH